MISTIATTEVPANAVNEDQLTDMLMDQGVYLDLIHSALYRLRSRATTLLVQGSSTYRFEKIAGDVYVVTLVPTVRRLATR